MKALIFTPMVFILALMTLAWAAAAAGTHEDILVKALIANAAGECPATLMAQDIKAACDQQLINTQDDGKILVLWAPNEPNWDIGSFSLSAAVSEH
jgi:hypothetical protein